MTINIEQQIEAAAHYRQQQMKKGGGKQSKVRAFKMENLHDNQPQALRQHLVHDNAHRMLDQYKAAPRNNRPIELDRRAEQVLNPPKSAADYA